MKKFITSLLLVGFALTSIGVSSAAAQDVPSVYPIQGFLTSDEGEAIDGEVDFRFRLYDSQEDVVHQEVVAVQVSNGSFLHYLGEEEALDAELFAQFGELELGIKAGTDDEMLPRLRVGSVPYAARAAMADHATTADLADHATTADSATHADSAAAVDGALDIYRVTNQFCEETPGTLMFEDRCYASQRNVGSCGVCTTNNVARRGCDGDCTCVVNLACLMTVGGNVNPRCNVPRCDNTEVGQIIPTP